MKFRQWSFFYAALIACAAFGLLASTPGEVAEPTQRASGSEVAFAAGGASIAELGSMTVIAHRERVSIAELGSLTVTARRWA